MKARLEEYLKKVTGGRSWLPGRESVLKDLP
jgi:hypothetical protein